MKFILNAILVFGLATALHAQDSSIAIQSKVLDNFDDARPVFNLEREQLTNKNGLLRYYALTGYREGVEPISGIFNSNFNAKIDRQKGMHRIKMYNLSIEDMLTHGLWSRERVILQVKDPAKYRYDPAYGPKENWLRKNGYCFELMMPVDVIKDVKLIEVEICRLFNLEMLTEKRMVEGKEKDVLIIKEMEK